MKTITIALSAAAMIAAAPVVLAQNVTSKAPDQHRHVSKKQVAPYAMTHAMHSRQMGQPGAFGYAPNPKDYTLESSRQAGGGGGGGSGM